MFAHIEGVVAEKTADSIVLDVHGVGFLLTVSGATLAAAPAAGERMKLYAVLSVREDAMELFGFSSREEKRMYERLRGVSGVGSRMAMQVLSGMSLRDLSIALATGDAHALTRIPGIGKKTAQRLVLELRDKIDDEQLTGSSVSPAVSNGPEAEAVAALIALGFTSSEAAKAVGQVAGQTSDANQLIFLALKGSDSGRG